MELREIKASSSPASLPVPSGTPTADRRPAAGQVVISNPMTSTPVPDKPADSTQSHTPSQQSHQQQHQHHGTHARPSVMPTTPSGRRQSMVGGTVMKKWEVSKWSPCIQPGGCGNSAYSCACYPCAAADIAAYAGRNWCDTFLLVLLCPLVFGPQVMGEDRVLFARRVGIKADPPRWKECLEFQCGCCCCLLSQERNQMMMHRERIREEVARALTFAMPTAGPTTLAPGVMLPPSVPGLSSSPASAIGGSALTRPL